ncbi:LysR substrate-binding domain-containing protein [Arenicella xantha]|uniref:LysR family hydrogen peroxide-inducible transcriptional activator n=1 Tax=Arenicella xantha TaxID=644221 RepID=A0A395JFW5_9GAMM|nr:LysR substrate-binding domain-containing protein [Arenicella xantha]RBP48311.1 LysR family hydrogen peroxide-inducible transcriptional activator [Arenicella xantha]
MNIRDFEYLVAVHELLNFSKAAERCHVSQPTLSGQLKKLEEELGTPLIERSTRQVMFTAIGEEVVAQARQLLQMVEQIRVTAKQADDPMLGEFRIGLIPTVGPFLLPIVMPLLSREFPQATIYLYELTTEQLIERLLRGELDAVILARLEWSYPVTEILLYNETMKLAVSAHDKLAANSSPVTKSVLDGRSVLMLEDGHCLRDQALGVCFAAGADEDKRFQATSLDTLLHMVGAGVGITLVPDLASRSDLANIKVLDFEEPQPTRDIVMLVRKRITRPVALHAIADVIRAGIKPLLTI